MTLTPFNDDDDDDAYRPELPNLWERTPSYAPTPGYPDREWTPSIICPSPTGDVSSLGMANVSGNGHR